MRFAVIKLLKQVRFLFEITYKGFSFIILFENSNSIYLF